MPRKSATSLPVSDDPHRELLMRANLLIASFRWKLRKAGYPFTEPPGVDDMIAKIDKAVFPNYETTKRVA